MTEESCVLIGNNINSPNHKNIYIPLSIFNNFHLSALETITKYMKEELGLSYREISFLINRNERTIWGSYNNSRRKMQESFSIEQSKFFIPFDILKDRSLSILEAVT